MLVYLDEQKTIAANPEDVASVRDSDSGRFVHVRMRDGALHEVPLDWGNSCWRTRDRIVSAVNAACTKTAEGA